MKVNELNSQQPAACGRSEDKRGVCAANRRGVFVWTSNNLPVLICAVAMSASASLPTLTTLPRGGTIPDAHSLLFSTSHNVSGLRNAGLVLR